MNNFSLRLLVSFLIILFFPNISFSEEITSKDDSELYNPAKSKGSSNPHNLVKATLKALLELRDARTVAMQRGVTMDKVFNG